MPMVAQMWHDVKGSLSTALDKDNQPWYTVPGGTNHLKGD